MSLGDDKQQLPSWRIRPMKRGDVARCLEIWLDVQLIESELTVSSSLADDPEGFYVAEFEDSGEIIGMCSGYRVNSESAFMGFYGVEPKYQGLGVGRALWAKTIERLRVDNNNIGLYGVPSMDVKYKKAGFVHEDSVQMLIFESKPGEQLKLELLDDSFDGLELAQVNKLDPSASTCCRLDHETNDSDELMPKIIEYDQTVQKFSRKNLLELYLRRDPEAPTCLVLLDCARAEPKTRNSLDEIDGKLSKDVESKLELSAETDTQVESEAESAAGNLLGYGVIRREQNGGAMIGPVYAKTPRAAEILVSKLIQKHPIPDDKFYTAMPLTCNQQAIDILNKIGLKQMDSCTRLFSKFVPEANFNDIYYIHSPNFSLF